VAIVAGERRLKNCRDTSSASEYDFGVKLLCCAALFCALSLPAAELPPDQVLLKEYRPKSIFNVPHTEIHKAKYPVIDVHTHVYAADDAAVEKWVKTMDEVGLEKSIILSGNVGEKFDAVVARFGKFPKRFDVWCGLDMTGFDQADFVPKVLAELERCKKAGARGVGELSDKGRGLSGAIGMHFDDPRMDPVLDKCAELGLPINVHIGEDQWMYEPMDLHNDGLMNGYTWRIATKDTNVLSHDAVLATLENAVKKHPRTTIIACHFANCSADLNRLGAMLDKYPNLYADMGARFTEITPIPRFVNKFFTKYQDRLLYGTDNAPQPGMYRTSFRILETEDEHFYPEYFAKYHWPSSGFGLSEKVLKKIYHENAVKITQHKAK
jgi:predicted TIM-barrel fold metal-dependent hydrolase